MQLLERFLVGGLIVSSFAVLGDLLRPKSFAGLFAAAPSIGLAVLCLALASDGKSYAALEARSMIGGAFAFLVYALLCMYLLFRWKVRTAATYALLSVWIVCALGSWLLFLRAPA